MIGMSYFVIQNSLFLVHYSYELVLVGIFHQADHAGGIGLAENILAVGLHGPFAQKKSFSDLFIA